MVIDDVLYFSANDGSTGGELYAYNTSNGGEKRSTSDDLWTVTATLTSFPASSLMTPSISTQTTVEIQTFELWAYDIATSADGAEHQRGRHGRRLGRFFDLVDDTIVH